jgi:membrane protein DedA with SNARE-associated domain
MLEFISFIQTSPTEQSAVGLFFIFFFGTFISEDATCLLAGTAVASGRISFGPAVLACLVGIFVGDIMLYAAGRLIGMTIFNNRLVSRTVNEATLDKATRWLRENATFAVFLTRFVSGLRLPTYLAAGALKTNFLKFALLFLIAAAVWTPILVGSTAFAQQVFFRSNSIIGIIVVLIAIRIALKFASWKNRRLLVGRVKRISNWEFWPLPVFYLPVFFYVLLLSVRFRSLTVFTSANPGIPASGFVGESKDQIYTLIGQSPSAQSHLLKHCFVKGSESSAEKIRAVEKFVACFGLSFPLILKPDIGERGKGVQIVSDERRLFDQLSTITADLIVQEHAAGVEVSIFYYRLPSAVNGQIFSITQKVFPTVVGDGISSLERLILCDKRAVCMAKKYFERLADRLDSVPAIGEVVQLIDIGTHSRGAIFRDGEWIKTAELESRINEICRGIKGFYFGRFDIKASSFEDLRMGKNFKIIELNGVSSESTNIYDPKYSLLNAYRILFSQWRLAFEIGAENVKRGAKSISFWKLIKIIFTRKAEESVNLPSGMSSETICA